jgi:UDP-glucuronate decarboxylase
MLQNDGRIISNFIVQALQGSPITIYGDGSQTRSFCYIDDLLAGLQLLMESPPEITGPFNLGNPEEQTVEQIARLIVDQTGSSSAIEYHPLPQDDPKRRRPVISRAHDVLGWSPRISLDEGLRATINYFSLNLFTGEQPSSPAASPERLRRRGSQLKVVGKRASVARARPMTVQSPPHER